MEKNNLHFSNQCGFRKNHSTTNNIHNLYSIIKSAIDSKMHNITVFIDLCKAFDRVWIDGYYLNS